MHELGVLSRWRQTEADVTEYRSAEAGGGPRLGRQYLNCRGACLASSPAFSDQSAIPFHSKSVSRKRNITGAISGCPICQRFNGQRARHNLRCKDERQQERLEQVHCRAKSPRHDHPGFRSRLSSYNTTRRSIPVHTIQSHSFDKALPSNHQQASTQ